MTLQDVLTYLADDLERRRKTSWCVHCGGRGEIPRWTLQEPGGVELCPVCAGAAITGKSPAITQAEEALKAVRGAVERERKLRELAQGWSDEYNYRAATGSPSYVRSDCGDEVLAILDAALKQEPHDPTRSDS